MAWASFSVAAWRQDARGGITDLRFVSFEAKNNRRSLGYARDDRPHWVIG